MRLKPLFSLLLSLFLVLILSVILFLNIKSAQSTMKNQLYTLTQDTVYSLSLSLASVGDISDVGMMEGMINAIFDSGYYEYIRLYDNNGSIVVDQSLPVVVKDVPKWFIQLLPLEISEAEGIVNKGWKSVGKLSIKAHAGHAYAQLWQLGRQIALSVVLIGAGALAILFVIINLVLRSLKRIKSQADAINENRFIVLPDVPFIREFKSLIEAMNTMVQRVEGIFEKEAEAYKNYLELLYKDEESSLPNKKYLILQLKEMLGSVDEESLGGVAIISLSQLELLKKLEGYQAYTKQLERIVEIVRGELQRKEHLYRISENELLMLFPSQELDSALKQLESVSEKLQWITKLIDNTDQALSFYIGLAPYTQADDVTHALSRVDYALSSAKMKGPGVVTAYDEHLDDGRLVLGKEEWHAKIETILEEGRIRLVEHAVYDSTKEKLFHQEIYLRVLEEDGSLKPAGYYLPMAQVLGLVDRFDHIVIETLFSNMKQMPYPVAINVGYAFVTHSRHFSWLEHLLSSYRNNAGAGNVHIECSENEILQDLQAYTELSEMVHQNRQLFGIDRFTGIGSIRYIKELRPDYIKINAAFVLDPDPDHQKALASLDTVSRSLKSVIIVTGVESDAMLSTLEAMGYRLFQGNHISGVHNVEFMQ